ncbi:hypothetical protein [Niabella beijingensis]|uniref:hypothetical protein n=1 Tax=Niabella beijingensis TaxID=2872700 RepID=UPI001CC1831B|nr:hypothetical protein [Niabella beijingensis]MBZ4187629.1 hypothetical protein [Niabella beijingensis]
MPRTKRNISKEQKANEFNQQLQHKLNSLKTDFESNKVESFGKINALIPPSVFARQLHMGYESFKSKCNNPGDFSNNELVRMAELIDIDINILIKFIFKMMKYKNKFKAGDSIRL